MAGIRARRCGAALFATVAMVVGAGLAVTAPSQAAEGDPVITWPSISRLNPTTSSYTVTTSYDGPDWLYLVLESSRDELGVQALPSTGPTDVRFVADYDGVVYLRAVRCPTPDYSPGDCTRFGSNYVYAYDEFVASLGAIAERGPVDPFRLSFQPWRPETLDLEWQIVPAAQPDGEPLVSGTIADLEPTAPIVLPAVGQGSGLVDGERYRYQVSFRGSLDPYGELEGAAASEFVWDGVNETKAIRLEVKDRFLGKQLKNVDVFYPAEDIKYGWRDRLQIVVLHPDLEEIVQTDITVTDGAGELVWEDRVFDSPHGWTPKGWSGTDAVGALVPEGTYDIEVSVVDVRGNAKSFERQVRVSHEQLVQATWEKTIRPKRYLVDKYVGRCAALKSPARPGWRESHGFRSNSGCGNPETQSVAAVYGIYLPRSSTLGNYYYRGYDRVRVTTYGGAPRSAKRSYLIHGYWSEYQNQWLGTKQFGGRVGAHPGALSSWRIVNGYKADEDPYILWSAGLSVGAQFDIKSFTVTARYWDVR